VRTVRDWSASRIWASYERLRSYDSVIRSADLPTLHGARIAGKRLRYALEFLDDVLGADQPALVYRLVALQDHLGELNDAALMTEAVRGFVERRQPDSLADDERAAIDRYLVDRERAIARLRRTVPWVWLPVAGAPFARRLGRAIIASPER
jgi:CHAD domain-containing protein